jgi:hypothetical protein
MRKDMVHALIATPTAGGLVKSLYAHTLVKTVLAMKDAGWDVDFELFDGCYVSIARNYFANLLLRKPHYTHLVMVDSDMLFESHVISRLIRSDKPVIAAAYAQRRMDMNTYVETARNPELELNDIAALSLKYNILPEIEDSSRVRLTDGMCRVERIALGCSAIRRDVFESLIAEGAARQLPEHAGERGGLEGSFYDFFSEIRLEDGTLLSEDYSFCKRWRGLPDREIWAVIDESIGHVGEMIYRAPYLSRLLRGKL